MMRGPLHVLELPTSGAHLIEASAGTGKTYTITSIFLRLLSETKLDIENILAVTFTNAATAELAQRVGARVAEAVNALRSGSAKPGDSVVERLLARADRREVLARLERALLDIDRASIFTIHGFAARILALYAFDTGLFEPRELSADERSRSFDVVTDFWSRHVATLPLEVFSLVEGKLFEQLTRIAKLAGTSLEVELSPRAVRASGSDIPALLARIGPERRALREAAIGQERAITSALLAIPYLSGVSYKRDKIPEQVSMLLTAIVSEGTLPDATYLSKATLRSSLNKPAGGVLRGAEHPAFAAAERYTEVRDELALASEALRSELLHRFATEIGTRLEREHELLRTRSFDSLLGELGTLLRRPDIGEQIAGAIRRSFEVVLIDEFQDTDAVQFEVFRRLFGDGGPAGREQRLYLIGDPKQSIYAFRGADVAAYLRVAGSEDVATHTLSTSYRASPYVVRAQNLLFSGPPAPFAVEGIRYEDVLPAPGRENDLTDADRTPLPGLEILSVPGEMSVEEAACRAVVRALSSGAIVAGRKLTAGDIAVLTRTNHQAQIIQARLGRLGIPAVMHGDRSVFEAEDAVELRRVLVGLLEPGNRALLRAALATRLLGVDAGEIASFAETPERLERWTKRLLFVGGLWRTRGITVALEELRSSTDFYARVLAEFDGQRRVTNYRHLLELLHEAETREHLGRVGLLRWLESAIESPTGHEMAAEARQLRLESDSQSVVLTTMHKSKGLEYGVVILPQVGTQSLMSRDYGFPFRFHDGSGAERLAVAPDPDESAAAAVRKTEEIQEALRVAYVGLTRARHQIVSLLSPGRSSALEYFVCEKREAVDALAALSRKKRSAEEVEEAVRELAKQSEGAIRFDALDHRQLAPVLPASPSRVELALPSTPPLAPSFVRTSSFSAMTRRIGADRSGGLSRQDREGRDVDGVDIERDVTLAPSAEALAGAEPSVLADFPRGARAGDVLHKIFERAPFEPDRSTERRRVVEEELARAGIEAARADGVLSAVERTLAVPLGHPGEKFLLGAVEREHRQSEIEFNMPIAPRGERLSPKRIAAVLARHASASGAIGPEYVSSVRQLEFSAFSGFLRGFIDLVVFAGGALHVLDYKSNYLGNATWDYGFRAMQAAMDHHHYLLQGLLYAVAVHRHGRRVIARYDYATHFGGIHYLFLRGIRDRGSELPDASEPGVYSFVPPRELIEELSLVLSGESDATMSSSMDGEG